MTNAETGTPTEGGMGMRDGDDLAAALEKLGRLKMIDPDRYELVIRWLDEYLSELEVLPVAMSVAKKSS